MPVYEVDIPGQGTFRVNSRRPLSDQEAYETVMAQLSEPAPVAPTPAPAQGIIPAGIGGGMQLFSSFQTAGESLFGSPEEAAKAGIARKEAIGKQYAPGADWEKVKKAYAERGILPAAYEAVSQVPSALAEQAPNIAATLAAGRAGATVGSLFGPAGTVIGGVGGAALPALTQLFGSNIERQAEAGAPEISRTKAAAAAIPGAALEVASTFIPLGRNVVGKLLGPQAEKALAKGTNEAIERLAQETLGKTLAKGAGVGTLAEGTTEVIQQMLERLQAGLPLTTPDALAEYGQAAYGAGLVGAPFGAVGRVGQRSIARSEKAAKEEEARAKTAEEARLKAEAEEQQAIAGRAGAPLLSAEEATMGAEFSAYDAEGRLKERQQMQAEVQQEYETLYKQEVNIQDQIVRAQKEGRTGDITKLAAERKRISDLRTKLLSRVKDKKDPLFGLKLQDPTLIESADLEETVQADIDNVKKRLAKAVDLGEFDKVDKLTAELEELKQKSRELRVQPDLFGTRYQTRMQAEEEARKAADEEMQRKQAEATDVVTLTNLMNLATQKREARAERKKSEEERLADVQQNHNLRLLELRLARVGLNALEIPTNEIPRIESEVDKGVLAPELASKLGVFDDDIAVAKRRVKDAPDAAQKAEAKAQLAELEAEIAKPQRAIDVLDKIDSAWEKASNKQRETVLQLAENKIDLFDDKGNLTKEGQDAVRNQVAVEQLTKLRAVGREARGVTEQQQTEQRELELGEAGLSGAQQFGAAAAQATRTLPQQRLQRQRARYENQIESINDQIRYLQSMPTVEMPGQPEFQQQIQDLELERREFEAAASRVSKEIGAEVDFAKPVDMNRSLSEFSDAIYPLQRGEFFGSRPTELTKTGKLTKVAQAEKARNQEIQSKINTLQAQLDIVKRRIMDPGLRNVDTRAAFMRDQTRLEGEIKRLKAGLSKQPGGKATFQMLVNRAEKSRDEYVNAAINQTNGVRAARNMPLLSKDEESKLRQEIAGKFNEFIKRASIAQRVPTEKPAPAPKPSAATAVGAALEKANIKPIKRTPRIAPERTPFAKIREALDVLREDLDETLAAARGDEKPAEPKFELKDYLEVLLGRAAQRPARRIRGTSQIEKIADSIERIDTELQAEEGVGAGADFISGLKARISGLKERAKELKNLQKMLAKLPKEHLDLYAEDPIIGRFLENPEQLQSLVDDARIELPKMEKLLKQELAKFKKKKDLEEQKAAKETERDAIIAEKRKERGRAALLKKEEIDSIQAQISEQQIEFKALGVLLFDTGRAIKVELPAKIKNLQEEIARLSKLAKTDRNPTLRQQKINRLKQNLKQARADLVAAKKDVGLMKTHRLAIEQGNKQLAKELRALGVETTITNEGEYILSQIEEKDFEADTLSPRQIDIAKKALMERIKQTKKRLANLPKIDTKTMEAVLERAKIGAVENIGVVDATGKRIAGRKVVFEEGALEYQLSEEEIAAEKSRRMAMFGPQIESLYKEFEAKKAELAAAKETPAVKAAFQAAEKAKAAIKLQKNVKDGERLAALAEKAKNNYDTALRNALSFPLEDIRKYPAKIAGLTRLQNAVATVRYVPTKVATQTELFVNNNKIEREAERQRFETSLRKEAPKPPIQRIEELLEEATAYLREAEAKLRKAEKSGNRALITAAKAEFLGYQRAHTTVMMKRAKMLSSIEKASKPKTESDAAVSASLDLDESLTDAEKARLKEAVDSYNVNREVSWAFGDEVTDVIDMDTAVKRMDNVVDKAAKRGIKVKYFKTLESAPRAEIQPLLDALIAQGKDIFADRMQGAVAPDGTVYVIIGHHNNMVDLEKTIGHEIIGHYTIDSILGMKGLVSLLRRVEKSFGSLDALAKKLGVQQQVKFTYDSAMASREHRVKEGQITEAEQVEFAKIDALRELLAYTTEKRIPKGIAETVKQFLQEVVGAVRQFFRDIGLTDASKISTSEIYKLIRSAKDRFEDGKPIAYQAVGDRVMLRGGQKAKWDSSVSPDIVNSVNKAVAKTTPTWEKLRANLMGLNFRTQFVDSIDALERIKKRGLARGLLDAVQAVDLTYFYRMYNQRMSFVSEAATNGVVQLIANKRADGKIEYKLSRDLQKDAASLKKVVLALAQARFGDAKANGDFFTLYMAAERALSVGKDKLDYTNTLTDKELDQVRKVGRADPAIQMAREEYNRYNKDLINLLAQSGAISKQKAAELLARKDYIPYYRQTHTGVVNLWIEGEKILKIGSITEQPALKELVGGKLDDDATKSQPIEDFFTSSLQNTSMIMDLALRNLAMRNTAFVMQGLGLAKRVSDKTTGTNIVRAKIDGEDTAWQITTEGSEVFGDIPADIIVKGLEGIKTVLPEAMRMAAIPADFFRKLVTRDPRYAIRQVFRDSMAAYMATGSDAKPLVNTTAELVKMYSKEGSKTQRELSASGITGGQVITGNVEDMSKILMQLTGGRSGWEMAMAKLDSFAMAGDAATRVSAYNSFLRQGLSDREATLATLETMNFSRRGVSPSMMYLNSLIPFFSANVQGLDVLYRAIKGDMPESQRLQVQRKLVARGAMMAGLTIIYAALMDDDEAYEQANAMDRYSNWFVKIPGLKEPFKVPIPFELGWFFKALPEGLVRSIKSDETGAAIVKDLAKMAARSIPGDIPLVMKPAIEVMADYSFFTGQSVVSARLAGISKEFQYDKNTPEALKLLGAGLSFRIGSTEYGLSPKQLEHLVRGYTGGFPLAILGMTDPVFRGFTAPNAVRPEMKITDVPVLGGLFQPVDAGGLIERAYETARAAEKANKTYKDLLNRGMRDEAKQYRTENLDLIAMSSMSGALTKQIGEISKQIRFIEGLPESRMTSERKTQILEKLRAQQTKVAKNFSAAYGKIERRLENP